MEACREQWEEGIGVLSSLPGIPMHFTLPVCALLNRLLLKLSDHNTNIE